MKVTILVQIFCKTKSLMMAKMICREVVTVPLREKKQMNNRHLTRKKNIAYVYNLY